MSTLPLTPPVPQPLHGPNWERPAGNLDFRVTQTFAHVNTAISPLPHAALDLGNTRLGAPITAPADGVVVAEGYLREPWSWSSTAYGTGNMGGIMAVIRHDADHISGLAHMSRTVVNKGQSVKRGQQVGNLGATGAAKVAGGHVHWDFYERQPADSTARVENYMVISYDGRKWRRIDAWPLLEQNVVPDTSIASGDVEWRKYAQLIPLTRLTLIGGTIPYKGPGRSYGEHSAGYAFPDNDTVLTTLEVELPDRTGHWFACDRRLNGGGIFWVPNSGIRKAEVIATDASTQQDAADAFRARIDGIKAETAAFAAKIAEA